MPEVVRERLRIDKMSMLQQELGSLQRYELPEFDPSGNTVAIMEHYIKTEFEKTTRTDKLYKIVSLALVLEAREPQSMQKCEALRDIVQGEFLRLCHSDENFDSSFIRTALFFRQFVLQYDATSAHILQGLLK